MEISHASTETQSAAVGINGKAEEVTVSTDAEFMMMIAHGIYSNKALALVRELLCNARDGHAKAEPKKSAPVPAPTSKAKAKVLKQPEPAKTAPQPSKPSGGTRQDRARALYEGMSQGSQLYRKQSAEGLRDLKKAAKVSWDALGLGKHNVEAELKKLLD